MSEEEKDLDLSMELYGVPDGSIKAAIETEFGNSYESTVDAVNDFMTQESGTEQPLPYKGAIRSADDLKIGDTYQVIMEGLPEPWEVGKLLHLDLKTYRVQFEKNSIIDILTDEENASIWVDLSVIGVCSYPNGKWTKSAFTIKVD